jgi:stearoyl-CoA desaturase (Delta-9 desaturase)
VVSAETSLVVPSNDRYKVVNWITCVAMVGFHACAIAALFYFSWTAVLLTAFFYWMCIGLGIGMGYHRLHTHRSYRVPKALEYFFAVCGALTLEGGPIFWVATHRIHHQNSDTDDDPHTPHHGGFWAHMGWILFGEGHHNNTELMSRYAPDLAADPFYRWLNTWHWVPLTVFGFTVLALGGWPMVFWLVFFRVTVGLHATWLVNSATHMWGQRRFATKDDSKNSWWVALLTFGEGWHNNHHAHPTSARHGLAWYEVDLTWLQIRLLQTLKVADRVRLVGVDGKQRGEGRKAA